MKKDYLRCQPGLSVTGRAYYGFDISRCNSGFQRSTSLRPGQFNHKEQLVRYYRCLSGQAREAVRCQTFARRVNATPIAAKS